MQSIACFAIDIVALRACLCMCASAVHVTDFDISSLSFDIKLIVNRSNAGDVCAMMLFLIKANQKAITGSVQTGTIRWAPRSTPDLVPCPLPLPFSQPLTLAPCLCPLSLTPCFCPFSLAPWSRPLFPCPLPLPLALQSLHRWVAGLGTGGPCTLLLELAN